MKTKKLSLNSVTFLSKNGKKHSGYQLPSICDGDDTIEIWVPGLEGVFIVLEKNILSSKPKKVTSAFELSWFKMNGYLL